MSVFSFCLLWNNVLCNWGVNYSFYAYLHLDIQKDNSALLSLLLNGHLASSIAIATELGVLHEAVLGNEVLERLHSNVVVVDAILLAGARRASSVRNGQAERIGVLLEEAVIQCSLADARRAGYDEGTAVGRRCTWSV